MRMGESPATPHRAWLRPKVVSLGLQRAFGRGPPRGLCQSRSQSQERRVLCSVSASGVRLRKRTHREGLASFSCEEERSLSKGDDAASWPKEAKKHAHPQRRTLSTRDEDNLVDSASNLPFPQRLRHASLKAHPRLVVLVDGSVGNYSTTRL